MKFGQKLHLYQIQEWESFYVSYGQLKSLFKSALYVTSQSKSGPDFEALFACLDRDIDALHSFYKLQQAFIFQEERQIWLKYGIDPDTFTTLNFEEVDLNEVKCILEDLLELELDLKKLLWFHTVNQHAITKVCSKVDKFDDVIIHLYHDKKSHWLKLQLAFEIQILKDIERIESLTGLVRKASYNVRVDSTTKSLYLWSFCNQKTPPLVYPDTVYRAIKADAASDLVDLLEQQRQQHATRHLEPVASSYSLLVLSISRHARTCTEVLLARDVPNNDATIDHSLLNHAITVHGRKTPHADNEVPSTNSGDTSQERPSDIEAGVLSLLLDRIGPLQKNCLQTADGIGRLPLHYSAFYGLTPVCRSILDALGTDAPYGSAAAEAISSIDLGGYTPLHLAVIHRHAAVTKLFVDVLTRNYESFEKARRQYLRTLLGSLLLVAIRAQCDEVVHCLVTSPVDVSQYRSSRGETAIYVAAQQGCLEYLKKLLRYVNNARASIDVSESVLGWTPLFVASANGDQSVAELLLQAGANHAILDSRGWTAREHAVFRGHLAIAEECLPSSIERGTSETINTSPRTAPSSRFHGTLGQNYLTLNLGATQLGQQRAAIVINGSSLDIVHGSHTDCRYSVEISTNGRDKSSRLVQLPLLDDSTCTPFVFLLKDDKDAMLTFRIFRATSLHGHQGHLLGSGTTLLEGQQQHFGEDRESLIRTHSTSILEKDTLNHIGTVIFTFVIARAFTRIGMPDATNPPLENAGSVHLVGHRGLGQNTAARHHLQLGENTVESFLSAAKLGASFVEFDVQLTKDFVPIVYHDFSLSESGTDIPIHDLSLDQFMYASKMQSPRGDPVSVLGKILSQTSQSQRRTVKRRSQSLSAKEQRGVQEVRERLEITVDFNEKGFKPNTRGDFVQDSFATLEELLVRLPKHISFDIEIKFPRLHEARDAGVAPVAIDINTFIDVALEKIFHFANDRTIFLSSFTPEVCILLSIKQQSYSVFFITNAGKKPVTDREARARSMQVAIRFARMWNLSGIVFASEILVLCPKLLQCMKAAGLSCASYGPLNNVPEHARTQAEAGIDIIMADRVGLIAKTLRSFQ